MTRKGQPFGKRRIAEGVVVLLLVSILISGIVILLHGTLRKDKPRPEEPAPSTQPSTLPAPSAPAPSVVTPAPEGGLSTVVEQVPIRVATANVYQRLSGSRAIADVSRLAVDDTDLIGLNEITPTRAGQLASWVSGHDGWHLYAPPTTPTTFRVSNSLLWNDRRLTLIDSGSEYGSPSGTRTYAVDSRWITWAQFKVKKTGTKLYFVVTHMDPAVERRGVPRSVPSVRTNQTYMAKLLTFCQKWSAAGASVIIAGDWNVNAAADRRVQASVLPFSVLEGKGTGPIISNYTALGFTFPPTSPKSRRWIDYVAMWSQMPPGAPTLAFSQQYSPRGGYSDHNPVIADLLLKVTKLIGFEDLQKYLSSAG